MPYTYFYLAMLSLFNQNFVQICKDPIQIQVFQKFCHYLQIDIFDRHIDFHESLRKLEMHQVQNMPEKRLLQ